MLHQVRTHAGVAMPVMIYGTAWKKERTADLVYAALKCGFRGIDTACQPKHYNEKGVGEGLARFLLEGHQRETVFVQTKFTPIDGQDPKQPLPYDPHASLAIQVAQSFKTSQENLGLEVIDSLVLHSPLNQHKDLMQVWRAMEVIYQDGCVRQLGISNCYDLSALQRLFDEANVKPAVVQNRFYARSGFDMELRAYCREHDIVYQSFWTLSANPDVLNHRITREIARKLNKSPELIFYRFMVQNSCVPLNGTTSIAHMKEDQDICAFELQPDDEKAIASLLFG